LLHTKRTRFYLWLTALTSETLRERAQEFWLVLDDVSITDLTFSPEYTVRSRAAAEDTAVL
jgi:hypothetical protein